MLIRLEAAKIVTGLTAYANLPSLYAETRWGKLNTRFKIRKLSLFYNIDKDDTHNYLSDLLSIRQSSTTYEMQIFSLFHGVV